MKSTTEPAPYGAAAQKEFKGELPTPFPRTIGPNAGRYLEEVVAAGLASDMVERFEAAFAQELGVKHCIATPGCTPALAVLAAAFDWAPGDEIIVSPITDFGTVQGLIKEAYIPVFADSEPGTINMSAATIEPHINERTRAILAVHMTGIICDMDPINELAARHGLMVYEDACQAVFGRYKGRYAGTLGHAAGFSFDAEKTMGSDVGGCLVTNDDALAEHARFVGHNRGGQVRPHFGRAHVVNGYALRMSQTTAAISLAQLEIAKAQVAVRDRMIRLLTKLLADIPGIIALPIPEYLDIYSCWMAGLSLEAGAFKCDAEAFAQQLEAEGIPGVGQGKYYLMPEGLVFLQQAAAQGDYPYSQPPASRTYRYSGQDCPTATAFLAHFIRWTTFCEKYNETHCEQAAQMIRTVAARNRV